MPCFQEVLDGKKTFEFRKNDRDFSVGDEVNLREYDHNKCEYTDRQLFGIITYLLKGPSFDIPEGYCIFGFHTNRLEDFIRDFVGVKKILSEFEDKLSHRMAGNITDRLHHTLNQFDSIAATSVLKAKQFIEDVKTQFKALELVTEGIAVHGNHTEKRVIANHVIKILRDNIDRIDRIDWEYSTSMFERYNFFRSESPEKTLLEKYRDLKYENERLKQTLTEKGSGEELPF